MIHCFMYPLSILFSFCVGYIVAVFYMVWYYEHIKESVLNQAKKNAYEANRVDYKRLLDTADSIKWQGNTTTSNN